MISTLQEIAIVLAALIGCLAVVLVPGAAGYWLSRAVLPVRWSNFIVYTFMFGSCGYFLYFMIFTSKPFHHLAAMPHYLTLLGAMLFAMIVALGMQQGTFYKESKKTCETELKNWQARLADDEKEGSKPLNYAFDLEQIGNRYQNLGQLDQAIASYERAYPIFVQELGNHPQTLPFLHSYAQALRRCKRTGDALKIEEQAAAIKE